MTFPFKEKLIQIEQLAKKQDFIFDDSVDTGIHIQDINEYDLFKEAINNIIEFYGAKRTTGYGFVEVDIAIPIEQQDVTAFACVILEVTYTKMNKPVQSQIKKFQGNNSFISIQIRNARFDRTQMETYYNSKIFE